MSVPTDHAIVQSIATEMRLFDSGNRLRALDSLTLIELVAALEDATGIDLLAQPLTIEKFQSVESICDLLASARGQAS